MISQINKEILIGNSEKSPSINKEGKIYSVTELSQIIKNTVENKLAYIKVSGEISNLKTTSANHTYFNIKDKNSIIFCTIWSFNKRSITTQIKEGDKVIVSGKVTTYSGQSRYQINVLSIKSEGMGDLMKKFEELKLKLAQYFTQKRSIPKYPKAIGVVTSATGSVLQDILHRIQERYPVKIILSPCPVQGLTAAKEISHAIQKLQSQSIDTIIIARGGGSVEDLWCFNDEELVKTIYNSKIPTISAVGHETDFTLSDFASDLRAPTPTAAAELSTPNIHNIKEHIKLIQNKTQTTFALSINSYIKHVDAIANKIKYNSPYLNLIQQLEVFKERFSNTAIQNKIQELKIQFQYKSNIILSYYQTYMQNTIDRLNNRFNQNISQVEYFINKPKSNLLNFIDKHSLTYITDAQDNKISSSKNTPQEMYINFIDGKIKVKKD